MSGKQNITHRTGGSIKFLLMRGTTRDSRSAVDSGLRETGAVVLIDYACLPLHKHTRYKCKLIRVVEGEEAVLEC